VTRQEIVAILKQGVHSITFTKVDGTERTMPCTLDPAILPPVDLIENEEKKVPRKLNSDTLRVFVTDINEWRSFRIDNLINIKGV
jgi:hypothetical protein